MQLAVVFSADGHYWHCCYNNKQILTKRQWRPPSKKKKYGKNVSPRNRKTCHSVSTALMQSVAKIGTQSTMKIAERRCMNSRRTSPKKRRNIT
jgi:hypothetical protein